MKKKNKNLDDLMAKLGASLKESPIQAHQRQSQNNPNTTPSEAKEKTQPKSKTKQASAQKSPQTNTKVNKAAPSAEEYERLQKLVQEQSQPHTPQSSNKKPSYRGWKTSTIGLYPEDYQKAREAMNYIQDRTGENTNLSRIIKIALRGLEVGPELLQINEDIKSKDGRLVSRRQNIA